MSNYTKQDILDKMDAASHDMATFYQHSFVNYRGTVNTGELYSELVAGYLLHNFQLFDQIPVITREKPYKIPTHDGIDRDPDSNREEEHLACALFRTRQDFHHIGQILDYQVPLANVQTDNVGKIDLIARRGSTLFLLELKRRKSFETLLRCVLEGETYRRTVCQERLIAEYAPDATAVVSGSLMFRGGNQYSDFTEHRPMLTELMQALGCRPYFLTERGGVYEVTVS